MFTSCATQEGDNQVTSIVPLATTAATAPDYQTSLSSIIVVAVVVDVV
jgi:hypothetical protein